MPFPFDIPTIPLAAEASPILDVVSYNLRSDDVNGFLDNVMPIGLMSSIDRTLCTISDFVEESEKRRSPPLEEKVPLCRHESTPPPEVTPDSSPQSDFTDDEGELQRNRGLTSRKGRTIPSLSDAVLIGYLDPNRPDIAQYAELQPLTASTPSEAEDSDFGSNGNASKEEEEEEEATEENREENSEDEDDSDRGDFARDTPMLDNQRPQEAAYAAGVDAQAIAEAAFKEVEANLKDVVEVTVESFDEEMIDDPQSAEFPSDAFSVKKEQEVGEDGLADREATPQPQEEQPLLPPSKPREHLFDLKPPPLSSLRTRTPSLSQCYDGCDSIATSPALAKFTIKEEDADPQDKLPEMQMSPPRTSRGNSGDSRQTLPSLTTTLSSMSSISDSVGTAFSGHSPRMTRPSPSVSQFGPSPSSYSQPSPGTGMSPPRMPTMPSMPSNPSFYRTLSTTSTPSEYSSATTLSSVPTESSTTSYPTPTTVTSENAPLDGLSGLSGVGSDAQDGLSSNGPFSNTEFVCTYPGCRAPPFQTQYLLNSHANVHSNTRPHFCPVKNCARGPGGQGFKRKNEMIRQVLASLNF